MLDLSLDHLGLITRPEDEETPGRIADGLAKIVSDIGEGEFTCLFELAVDADQQSCKSYHYHHV